MAYTTLAQRTTFLMEAKSLAVARLFLLGGRLEGNNLTLFLLLVSILYETSQEMLSKRLTRLAYRNKRELSDPQIEHV